MGSRDRVRVESNERVDIGDFRAMQENARTALRRAFRSLLLGSVTGDNPYAATTAMQARWALSTAGTELTVTRGTAWAGEEMSDTSVEVGDAVGAGDGDAAQVLDFNGESANTYYVWVRADSSPAVKGSRIFWAPAPTDAEVPRVIDTREVNGWRVVKSNSSSPPDARYVQVGKVVWDGGAFTSVSTEGLYLFEGSLNSSGVEAAPGWGGGVNDRNADRAQYGVKSIVGFAAAMRRQVGDIIGGTWFQALPQSVRFAASATLTMLRDHVDDASDPHGATLTQTNVTSSGTVRSDGVLDVNGTADFAQGHTVHDDVKLRDGANIQFTDTAATSLNGLLVEYVIPISRWHTQDWSALLKLGYGAAYYLPNGGATTWLVIDLTAEILKGAQLSDDYGPYIVGASLFGTQNSGTAAVDAIKTSFEKRDKAATVHGVIKVTSFNGNDWSVGGSSELLDFSGISDDDRRLDGGLQHRIVVQFDDVAGVAGPDIYHLSVTVAWRRNSW